MKTITNHDLLQLVNDSNKRRVSLYMPIYTGAECRQNPTRLKKLLRQAEDELRHDNSARTGAAELLAPLNDLLEHLAIGKEGAPALAMFAEHGGCRTYRVPAACDEECVVGPHYHILPAVKALAEIAAFYILALSQNQIRLLHGTKDEIAEVEVPNLPANMEEALNLDDRQSVLQAHQARPRLTGKEGLAFHGQGGQPDAAKAELLNYCREIERAIGPVLRNESDPMVFAGVDYLFPMFREVTQYRYVLPNPIAGNPELLPAADLRKQAWNIVQSTLEERRDAALTKHGNCISQGRTANSIDDILVAASAGAVETLFVDASARRPGIFDPVALSVHMKESEADENEDLVNLAAVIVLRNSGMVMPIPPERVPGSGPAAATLRYVFPPATDRMGTASPMQRQG